MLDDVPSFPIVFDEPDSPASTTSSDDGGPAAPFSAKALLLSFLPFHLSKLEPPGISGLGIDDDDIK